MFAHPRHLTGAVRRARNLRRHMPLAEKLLWAELRKLGLNIRRQAPIGRYIADFACHAAKAIVEVDGRSHRLDEAMIYDHQRDEWLRSQGYRVLRVSDDQVLADPPGVAVTVANFIRALPLNGGGLGGGASPPLPKRLRSAPDGTSLGTPARTPPSPTLPPLRGKGE